MICKLCSSAIKIFLTRQFFTFSFFGLVALLINLGARLALNLFFSFSISVFLAHIFAMGCAYFLFQTYVFRSYRNFKSSLFKFLIMPKYCRILTLHFILLPFALNALADSFTTAFFIQPLPLLVNHRLDIDFLEVILNFLEIFFLRSNYSKIGTAVIFDI